MMAGLSQVARGKIARAHIGAQTQIIGMLAPTDEDFRFRRQIDFNVQIANGFASQIEQYIDAVAFFRGIGNPASARNGRLCG